MNIIFNKLRTYDQRSVGIFAICLLVVQRWLLQSDILTVAVMVFFSAYVFDCFLEVKRKDELRILVRQEAESAVAQERYESLKNARESKQMHMVRLCDKALTSYEEMASGLTQAEAQLDQAELNFREGAFAPFWDSIERVAILLAEFDQKARLVKSLVSEFKVAAESKVEGLYYESDLIFDFPIHSDSVGGLQAAFVTTSRWKDLVRKAQCNFQFATIFEQRRTNQLIASGFQNLTLALEGMGKRIAGSIDMLGGSIDQLGVTIVEGSERLRKTVDKVNDSIKAESIANAQRSAKALQMLDNIQRRKLPMFPGVRDQQY
jgi:hypothetical protein